MLKRAIQRVIDDASYHLNVEPVATALRQASYIAEWITHDENKAIFDEFETRPVKKLKILSSVAHVLLFLQLDYLDLFEQTYVRTITA